MILRKAYLLVLLLFVISATGCSAPPKSPQISLLYRHGFTVCAEGTDEAGDVLYRSSLRYENGCLTVLPQQPSSLTLTICGEKQQLFSEDSSPVQVPSSILTPWRGLTELLSLTSREEYWQQSYTDAGMRCFTLQRADGLQAKVWVDELTLTLRSASVRFADCVTFWRFTDFAYLSAPQE